MTRSSQTNSITITLHNDDGLGYGFDYAGFGLRCPVCNSVGTYVSCSKCGYVMEKTDD